jgi:hypothetical protein
MPRRATVRLAVDVERHAVLDSGFDSIASGQPVTMQR